MIIFKKKPKIIDDSINDSIKQIQYEFEQMRNEFDSMKRDYERLKASIPGIAQQRLEALARTKAITIVSKYRDEEFLVEVCASRIKELSHKKQALERAIDECDKALAEIKGTDTCTN